MGVAGAEGGHEAGFGGRDLPCPDGGVVGEGGGLDGAQEAQPAVVAQGPAGPSVADDQLAGGAQGVAGGGVRVAAGAAA